MGAALALPALAQWKWRDPSGRVQYSDLPPPPNVAAKDILQRPVAAQRQAASVAVPPAASAPPLSAVSAASAASGAASQAAKTVEPELEARRRKGDEEKATRDKAEDQRIAAVKADNCSRAKGQLRALDDGLRIARTNAKGEREVLDDQGRAQERRRTQDIVNSDCR